MCPIYHTLFRHRRISGFCHTKWTECKCQRSHLIRIHSKSFPFKSMFASNIVYIFKFLVQTQRAPPQAVHPFGFTPSMEMLEKVESAPIFFQLAILGFQIAGCLYQIEHVNQRATSHSRAPSVNLCFRRMPPPPISSQRIHLLLVHKFRVVPFHDVDHHCRRID